jgi:hypothetical protein
VAPGTVTRVEAHLKTNAGPCLRPLLSQPSRFYHHIRHYIKQQPIQSYDPAKMTSVNTPEEQAIAFLLTCVENSQKGKVRNT